MVIIMSEQSVPPISSRPQLLSIFCIINWVLLGIIALAVGTGMYPSIPGLFDNGAWAWNAGLLFSINVINAFWIPIITGVGCFIAVELASIYIIWGLWKQRKWAFYLCLVSITLYLLYKIATSEATLVQYGWALFCALILMKVRACFA